MQQNTRKQDTGKQDTGKQDTGKQDTGKQDTGEQNTGQQDTGQPGAARWFAVFTKPRQEQMALVNLERQGFECFLPMALNPYQKVSKRNEDRTEPLFPRYLFLRADPGRQSLASVRSTRGAMDLVRCGAAPLAVPEEIVTGLLRRRDPETDLIALDPVDVALGERVRVFDGPFAGAEGILAERNGERRSLVLLDILGRQAPLEVDAMLLQRVV